MNTKWNERKLSDIATMIDYRGKTPQKSTSGIPLITAKIVKNGTILPANEFIAENQYASWMTRGYPCVGDVVMTTEAPLGEVAQLRDAHVALAQRIITIRGKKDVLDNGYLKYFLQSAEGQGRLRARETGTTVTGIKAAELRELMIPLPDIVQQRKISKVLLDLDEKIYNLTQENHNLEEQAKAIFKSWFVDFEPFQDGGFVDSEHGQIPIGWRIGTFGEIANISSGKRPSKKSVLKSEECMFPLIGASCVMGFTCSYLYDTPIIVTGRVGTHGIIQYFDEKCWPSDNTLVIQSKFLNFAYQYLHTVDFTTLNRGSTQPLITQSDIKKQSCLIAPEYVMLNFEEKLQSIRVLIQNNLCENYKLAQLRDALLPKLMSGEIEVSEVEV